MNAINRENKSFRIQHTGCFIVTFMAIAISIAYIAGGNNIIAQFYWSAGAVRLGMLIVVIVAALFLTRVCFRRYNLEQKISDFSWRNYWTRFRERYHCNIGDGIILVIAMAVGGSLRLMGYDWGVTSIFHPDEWNFVHPAIEMVTSKSIYQMSTYFYPAQFSSKIAAIFIWLYSKCTGTEIAMYYTPQAFFIYRILVSVAGTATILICFLIGNYVREHLGTVFAVLSAVYPVYIWQAKQATGDVVVFCCLCLTMLFSLRYMEEKRNVFLILMTMGAAMATLEKWHGAIGIGYTGFVILLNNRKIKELICKGLYALGMYLAWILLLAPNVVFQLKTAIVDGFINIAVWDGQEGAPYYKMLLNYGKFGIQHYCGIIYLLAMFIGIVYVIHNFDKKYIVFLMGILKILILCLMNRQYVRWGMELYFCEIMLVSMGICQLLFLEKRRRCLHIIGEFAVLIVALELLSGSMVITMGAVHSENDTRLIQREDCVASGITPDNSISAWYTGFVPGGLTDISWGWVEQGPLEIGLFIENERLYKTSENIEYAILNISDMRTPELAEAVRINNPVVFSYNAEYRGTFEGTLNGLKGSWNDIVLIGENMHAAAAIHRGALLGADIEVYDISEVPYVLSR